MMVFLDIPDSFDKLKFGSAKKSVCFSPLKQTHFKGASDIIKFLAGSCLSGLGIVLKEP